MANKLLDFIVNSSLYTRFVIEHDPELQELVQICNGDDRFEMFCSECGDKKVFIYDGGLNDNIIKNIENGLHSTGSLYSRGSEPRFDPLYSLDHMCFRFKCSLDQTHKLEFFFTKIGNEIIKVGQYPSTADLDLPQAKKYVKILENQYYNELKRAIQLNAHGVGIGSFVYLRRIIEKLVLDAFKEAEAACILTKDQFEYQEGGQRRNTVEDKIKLLKGILPDLITENSIIYGVVSKGIHELSEEECMKYFPVLKRGIEMILDEIVAKKEKQKSEMEYRKALGSIVAEVK